MAYFHEELEKIARQQSSFSSHSPNQRDELFHEAFRSPGRFVARSLFEPLYTVRVVLSTPVDTKGRQKVLEGALSVECAKIGIYAIAGYAAYSAIF